MAISKYNFALDFTSLALASAVNGDFAKAGKLLLKASKQHDAVRAVATLEASNEQAFNTHQAKVSAAAKAAAKPKTGAGKRLAAAAAAAPKAKTKVKAFDMGDESEIDDLIEDGGDEGDDDVAEAAVEDMDDDEEFDTEFASIMAGMKANSK